MAFPTTSVIDSFKRPNESPLATSSSGVSWVATDVAGGATNRLKVLSNAVAPASGNNCSQYLQPTYGPDSEAFITSNGSAGLELWVRLSSVGTANYSGYKAYNPGGVNATKLFRVDNGADTQLGATSAQSFTNGDKLGLEALGTAITLYREPSAGVWGALISATDSTYSGAGAIAVGAFTGFTTGVGADFGGGTVIAFIVISPIQARVAVGRASLY